MPTAAESVPCVAVAYSGGRDSSALLHATVHEAAALRVRVVALHVHHGLSADAEHWLLHCEQQCRRWAARGLPVAFDHQRVVGRPQRGVSVEAWARSERYAALRDMALRHGAPVVLLAHHRQDQAETVILQALRGAGVAGLSAMPREIDRAGLTWVRPWLECGPEAIAAYVRRYRLSHIEDDSNADRRFARNRLRHDVWPALISAFPQAATSLSVTAAWAREAQLCANDLAAIDLATCADAGGLDLDAWARLSPARRSNALRTWLGTQTGEVAAATVVRRLLAELPGASPAQWGLVGFTLRRYQGRLSCHREGEGVAPSVRSATLAVVRAGTYVLPGWGGRLRVRRVAAGGVALSRLQALRLVERSGGEKFQAAPGRPPRGLKKQFQDRSVPAWERDGPLLFDGEHLLYVPGLGIDARVLADGGVRHVSLEWLPDRPGVDPDRGSRPMAKMLRRSM